MWIAWKWPAGLAFGAAVSLLACGGGEAPPGPTPSRAGGDTTPWPVTLVQPERVGTVPSGQVDILGRSVGASCATCHEEHLQPPFASRPEELREIHLDMPWAHGELTCFMCHDQADRSLLHLADGRTVGFKDARRLCEQCHGPQARDYQRGAHGGMNGHWDLARGPRVRNSCLGCHDAHRPGYPQVMPVFAPRDRFLGPTEEGGSAHPPEEE